MASSSSTSGSSKRARGANNGVQPISCLVDGCISDLSNCRDYHRRHKVCELHSKTPQVSIGGLIQRFCQQCSRFHSLEEFDEGKRSCRKRLDGHNRRRRKPQADLMPRSANFYSYHQGSPLLPFSSSQVFPSAAAESHEWPEAADHRNQQLNFLEKHNLFVESSNRGGSHYKAGKELAFLHGDSHIQTIGNYGELACRPLLRTMNDAPESGGGRNKMVYERLRNVESESDCALSLLSTTQAKTDQNEGESCRQMGFSRIEQMLQPLKHSSFETADESHAHGIVNFHGMFGIGSDNAGNIESPSTLPFHWE